MKILHYFSVFSVLVSFAMPPIIKEVVAADAAEVVTVDPNVELKAIVTREMPQTPYIRINDLSSNVHAHNSLAAWQLIAQSTQKIVLADTSGVSSCGLALFPDEVTLHVLQFLSATDLVRLGGACRFFYQMTRAGIYLNDYCLQEGIPNSMPVDDLVRRARNTRDGVHKLAQVWSVTPEDLLSWFGQPCLDGLRDQLPPVPARLQDQTEDDLKTLYPNLKLLLASTLSNPDHPLRQSVLPLFQEYKSYTLDMSYHTYLVLSLNPDAQCANIALHNLMSKQDAMPIRDLAIRKLLLARHQFSCLLPGSVVFNPRFRTLAVQVLQWCCDHQIEFEDAGGYVWYAHALGEHKLAMDILRKLIALPDDYSQHMIGIKTLAFTFYPQEKEFKSTIAGFSGCLLGEQWAGLSLNNKLQALRLFIRTDNKYGFKEKFLEFLSLVASSSDTTNDFSIMQFSQELTQYRYEDAARQLTERMADRFHAVERMMRG